jgi:hypothetical protein
MFANGMEYIEADLAKPNNRIECRKKTAIMRYQTTMQRQLSTAVGELLVLNKAQSIGS